MTFAKVAGKKALDTANYDPGLGVWRIVSTLCGFLCLWFSIAAFIDLGDTSKMAWFILALGVMSLIEYAARFQMILDSWFHSRTISNTILALIAIPAVVYGCYRTALYVYQ